MLFCFGWLEQLWHSFTILGYESCFLPDPTNLDLSAIKRYDIGLLASELKAIRCGRRSTINPEHFRRQEQPLSITAKRKAQLWELNEFLKTVKNVNGLFRGNPQVFISYAWEESNTPEGKKLLARQQSHLRQLAHDLTTLGFPTWLDVERMVGNVDEQMAGNIESSSFAIVICTPRYAERAKDEKTNVYKEFTRIMKKRDEGKIVVLPVLFMGEQNAIPEALRNYHDYHDFRSIDDGDGYIQQLTSIQDPVGLIPRIAQLGDNLRSEYQRCLDEFSQQLHLLPAKHLLVNKGQKILL